MKQTVIIISFEFDFDLSFGIVVLSVEKMPVNLKKMFWLVEFPKVL